MAGGLENRIHRPLLHDPAFLHHGNLIGESGDDTEVVCDEHHGHRALAFQVCEQRENLRLHGHIQSRRRLVCNQQSRLACERDREHHPLSHSS